MDVANSNYENRVYISQTRRDGAEGNKIKRRKVLTTLLAVRSFLSPAINVNLQPLKA